MPRNGRPPREDIDMVLVHSLLPSLSLREIAKRIGVPQSTLSYRLRAGNSEPSATPNPFCIADRKRMRLLRTTRGVVYYVCVACHATTRPRRPVRVISHRKGRPPKEFDYATVSELIKSRSVADVAAEVGIHRNTIYRYIAIGEVQARPFRTWIPRGAASLVYWPYMAADDPRYAGLIRAVNEAVPRTLGDSVRPDVCQEIMVSVLSGEINEAQIASAVRDHLKKHYKQFPVKAFGVLSLDAPICSDRDLRLGDTLDAERVAERIRNGLEANRLTQDRPRSYKHVSRLPRRVVAPDILPREYDRLRRTYQFLRSRRVAKTALEQDRFGGAWSVETALPEERRPELSLQSET